MTETQSQRGQNEKLQVQESFSKGLWTDPLTLRASSLVFLPNGQPNCAGTPASDGELTP